MDASDLQRGRHSRTQEQPRRPHQGAGEGAAGVCQSCRSCPCSLQWLYTLGIARAHLVMLAQACVCAARPSKLQGAYWTNSACCASAENNTAVLGESSKGHALSGQALRRCAGDEGRSGHERRPLLPGGGGRRHQSRPSEEEGGPDQHPHPLRSAQVRPPCSMACFCCGRHVLRFGMDRKTC